MKPSTDIADFIMAWEGCQLQVYLDAAGKPTVGFGHLLEPNEPHPMSLTLEQACQYFDRDLEEHAQAVDDMITVDVAQHEFDALVSFAFNLGADALRRSTLLRKVNDRRFDDAAHEFERWVYAGQKKLLGLVKRRKAECDVFTDANYRGRP